MGLIVLTTDTGRRAEAAAKVYLEMRRYKVIEQNWRRSRCEIDIVAEKDNVKYFVEVKYRYDNQQGGCLEAITTTKLRQMRRAADTYIEEHKWSGEYLFSAIEIAGDKFVVLGFIDNVF